MAGWKPGTRLLLGGLALLAVGLAGTVVMRFADPSPIDQLATHEVPGTFTEQLEPGQHLVALKFATTYRIWPFFSFYRSQSVDTRAIEVTGPDGEPMPLQDGSTRTVVRGNSSYVGSAFFRAETAGAYTIHVEPSRPTTAIAAPTADVLAGRSAGSGYSGLVIVAGLALTVWGLIRRRNANRPPAGPPPPPGRPPLAASPPPWPQAGRGAPWTPPAPGAPWTPPAPGAPWTPPAPEAPWTPPGSAGGPDGSGPAIS